MTRNTSSINNKSRHNFKWSINETLRLQREYELLELSVQEISRIHNRSFTAILYRLELEGFISSNWNEARGFENFDFSIQHNTTNDIITPSIHFQELDSYLSSDEEEIDDKNDSDYIFEEDEDDARELEIIKKHINIEIMNKMIKKNSDYNFYKTRSNTKKRQLQPLRKNKQMFKDNLSLSI
jgi:hypothetical protein